MILRELKDLIGCFERHQEIIDRIDAIPPDEQGYELKLVYAHALTLLDRAGEALSLLESLRRQGEEEANWHTRMGHTLSWLRREPEAMTYLEKALELVESGKCSEALGADKAGLDYLLGQTAAVAGKRSASVAYYRKRLQNRTLLPPDKQPFAGFDLTDFWRDSDYAKETYLCPPFTDELVAELERELGYKLPAAYLWLMKQHNGGMPASSYFPLDQEAEAWADEFVSISGILGISREKPDSLGGYNGYELITGDWGYPKIGVPVCQCDGDHEVIFLDYTCCGPQGEPVVVLVEDYEKLVTYLADDFESFIRSLRDYPENEEEEM